MHFCFRSIGLRKLFCLCRVLLRRFCCFNRVLLRRIILLSGILLSRILFLVQSLLSTCNISAHQLAIWQCQRRILLNDRNLSHTNYLLLPVLQSGELFCFSRTLLSQHLSFSGTLLNRIIILIRILLMPRRFLVSRVLLLEQKSPQHFCSVSTILVDLGQNSAQGQKSADLTFFRLASCLLGYVVSWKVLQLDALQTLQHSKSQHVHRQLLWSMERQILP